MRELSGGAEFAQFPQFPLRNTSRRLWPHVACFPLLADRQRPSPTDLGFTRRSKL